MATCRAQVGVRRRGPVLSRSATRLPTLLLALVASGCVGLSDDEQRVLDVHQQNSQMYFQSGAWRQALHQANMALKLDDDLMGMRIIKGHCLTRLGSTQDSIESLDASVELFDDLCSGAGQDDHRAWMGSGQAHLARAMYRQAELDRIERRLASDFLTEAGRKDEQADFEEVRRGRTRDLEQAEASLLRVFEFELQKDNVYAMMDLVSTLLERGDHEDEAVAWARRSVGLLRDAVALNREKLSKDMTVSARHKLDMQKRVEDYLGKEAMLRDIIVTIEFNRGSYQRCLEEYEALESRGMMGASQHFNRAQVYEHLGMWAEAIDDLQAFLRLRARDAEYDDQADEVFDRIEALQRMLATGSAG